MHQDQCVEIAREAATLCGERHSYMPTNEAEAANFQPHRWVIDAMLSAAVLAESERDSFRAGNTELLGLWMMLIEGADIIDVQELVREILEDAGLLVDGKPDWAALEARKPQRKSRAQTVNELVTDPAERERLLAMGD